MAIGRNFRNSWPGSLQNIAVTGEGGKRGKALEVAGTGHTYVASQAVSPGAGLCYASHRADGVLGGPGVRRPEYGGMQDQRLKPLEVWEPRCHGDCLDYGFFLICTLGGIDVIAMIPPNVGSDPLQIYERLLHDDDSLTVPLGGGPFSLSRFDFTLLRTDMTAVPEFFIRVFASPQISAAHWFNRFLGAQILIRSQPTLLGTIGDVLRSRGMAGLASR